MPKSDRTALVIDAASHPVPEDPEAIREFLAPPYRGRALPSVLRYFYPAPTSESSAPVSSEVFARHVLAERQAEFSILLPLTRGLLPDLDLGSELCHATNRWLKESFLASGRYDGRLRGSIRINPEDPDRALEEIGLWSEDPLMVQVAVPLQSHSPYGHRRYHQIWAAAEKLGLPVAVKADEPNGVEYWPTALGYPRSYAEYVAQRSLIYLHHLVSLVAQGVFDRYPGLIVVFVDGGIDLATPIMWRFDKDWRPSHPEIPWVKQLPSHYLRSNVRFCSNGLEGPTQSDRRRDWLLAANAPDLLLYASRYPFTDGALPETFQCMTEAERSRILQRNAAELYKLPIQDH
jgi:uncharacterized protein